MVAPGLLDDGGRAAPVFWNNPEPWRTVPSFLASGILENSGGDTGGSRWKVCVCVYTWGVLIFKRVRCC